MVVQTAAGWRLEWGASQRPYFKGHELRFRCESGLAPDVQILWLSRAFAQALESDVFQRFTDANQTRIDSSMPDEMRWLAMHPKVSLSASGALQRRFALFCNAEAVAHKWLEHELLMHLESAASQWWTDSLMLVLVLNRGMLTLRMPGVGLEPAQLRMVGEFYAQACRQMRRVAA
jgi:hypothetical protein